MVCITVFGWTGNAPKRLQVVCAKLAAPALLSGKKVYAIVSGPSKLPLQLFLNQRCIAS